MGRMRMAIICSILVLATAMPTLAQEDEAKDLIDRYVDDYVDDYMGGSPGLRSGQIVDSPMATVLRHGDFRIRGRIMDGGSLVASTEVGIRDRFSVGVSWGMQGLLGRSDVEFNDQTALMLRLLLIDELSWPSLVIGFDNQGYGAWDEDLERYERKSKGFYLAATRNWYGPLGSDVATTVGINYGTEEADQQSVDGWFGVEQDFGNRFALLMDYSLGLDDREDEEPDVYGRGLGWLDLGMRWNIGSEVQFRFYFRDLLGNYAGSPGGVGRAKTVDRQFEIVYQGHF